ncbi:MAG: HD-GYP domain-containing protein [Leptospiraceae bacterium]|nr:HD-GYP domain-containing protein [Leptospiraceae bacterium]MCK6380116.1 HD-GYP domain-containing protein [Leptospiraceae bacterium]NUM41587.1 HD-GYP domain-containing protein [Leptospiraceae bacterium]
MKLNVKDIKNGTILDGKVTDLEGNTLSPTKIVFTKEFREKLNDNKISEILYEPEIADKKEKLKEDETIDIILENYHFGIVSRESIQSSITSLRKVTFDFLRSQNSIDFYSCRFAVRDIYREIRNNPSALVNLMDIRSHDYYTLCHSINVGIIALNLAIKMGYNDEEVQLIGLGGFLHDIGKIAIPASLINKTGVLSEEEKRIMKSHPSHSKRIMENDKNINKRIVNMAYEHHERFDGKGYPRGISGDTLDDYSVIVALADVYDALTTVRSYKPAFSPEESIQVIETYTGTHFAPRIAEKFIHDIQSSIQSKNQLSKGFLVLLNTGEIGQIVDIVENPIGPEFTVSILSDPKTGKVKNTKIIRLAEDEKRKIERTLNPKEINLENYSLKK